MEAKTHDSGSRGTMTSIRDSVVDFLQKASHLLGMRRESGPIDSLAGLQDFVATRSAYVAQKTLYGYVRTRMGLRYVSLFEDKNIALSLNIARHYVFAACLSDLTIYALAVSLYGRPIANAERAALAARVYEAGLSENRTEAPAQFSAQNCIDDFRRRLVDVEWRNAARQPEIFNASPKALMRWAPIADELKKLDREIVENSVRFSWRPIRDQLQTRLDAEAVAADCLRNAQT
jgi:hypothetical protein